ncbi:MbtH family NRPS accessory protein [Enterobacter hormaechei]|nr:MbtH family NRPS accessory protein [Enterobacter hormaechei]
MEFSNPFDNPQGQFAILQNDQGQYSLWTAAVRVARGLARGLRTAISGGVPAVAGGTVADA